MVKDASGVRRGILSRMLARVALTGSGSLALPARLRRRPSDVRRERAAFVKRRRSKNARQRAARAVTRARDPYHRKARR
jgi:hypothetical protein